MLIGRHNILMGGQAGSEAKGKQSAYLVDKFKPEILAMTASPNAGHTVIVGDRKVVTYHLPAGLAGADYRPTVVLGPASVINPDIFNQEMRAVGYLIGQLIIDPRATIITPGMMRQEENTLTKIGSTAQGVGMARIARIQRVGVMRISDVRVVDGVLGVDWPSTAVMDAEPFINTALADGATVLHESTQGFDLCLDHGIDPVYCTTRNITTAGALAEFGIAPSRLGHVYGVIRPFPIRVNNRDGSSGPYAEAAELDWGVVGHMCHAPHDITEKTTTTHLTRRVFEFCMSRFEKFVRVCDPDFLCLQFTNYLNWSIYGMGTRKAEGWIPPEVEYFVDMLRRYKPVAYLGTGPDHTHMIDLGIDNG